MVDVWAANSPPIYRGTGVATDWVAPPSLGTCSVPQINVRNDHKRDGFSLISPRTCSSGFVWCWRGRMWGIPSWVEAKIDGIRCLRPRVRTEEEDDEGERWGLGGTFHEEEEEREASRGLARVNKMYSPFYFCFAQACPTTNTANLISNLIF